MSGGDGVGVEVGWSGVLDQRDVREGFELFALLLVLFVLRIGIVLLLLLEPAVDPVEVSR